MTRHVTNFFVLDICLHCKWRGIWQRNALPVMTIQQHSSYLIFYNVSMKCSFIDKNASASCLRNIDIRRIWNYIGRIRWCVIQQTWSTEASFGLISTWIQNNIQGIPKISAHRPVTICFTIFSEYVCIYVYILTQCSKLCIKWVRNCLEENGNYFKHLK